MKIQQLQQEKETLIAEQKKGGKNWTPEKQERLDAVVEELIDATDALDSLNAEASETASPKPFIPEPGDEGFYHVKMTNGKKKFNPETGEQFNFPFVQKFTKSEYKHFKEFGGKLGYVDIEVLWDPAKNSK